MGQENQEFQNQNANDIRIIAKKGNLRTLLLLLVFLGINVVNYLLFPSFLEDLSQLFNNNNEGNISLLQYLMKPSHMFPLILLGSASVFLVSALLLAITSEEQNWANWLIFIGIVLGLLLTTIVGIVSLLTLVGLALSGFWVAVLIALMVVAFIVSVLATALSIWTDFFISIRRWLCSKLFPTQFGFFEWIFESFVACVKWGFESMTTCLNWGLETTKKCFNWLEYTIKKCAEFAEQTTRNCLRFSRTTTRTCTGWARRTSRTCAKWLPSWLGWACFLWRVVVTVVCLGWRVVVTVVCIAWAVVVTLVCILWSIIVAVVCLLWFIIVSLICILWGIIVLVVCLLFAVITLVVAIIWFIILIPLRILFWC